MAEISLIERIVDAAVSRILESHIPSLREEMVRSVVADLLPEFAKSHGEVAGAGGQSEGERQPIYWRRFRRFTPEQPRRKFYERC